MNFYKQSIAAHANSSPCETGNKFPLAAGRTSFTSRKLDRVCGIIYHRPAKPSHYFKRAHIANQIIISKTGPTFSNKYLSPSGTGYLFNNMPYIPGGHKLSLFDVNYTTSPGTGNNKVCLPAKKSRYLNNI